jgi:hypothetical protein
MNLICFRHPEYQGTSSPVLSCKTCCTIFLAVLKTQAEAKGTATPVETPARANETAPV